MQEKDMECADGAGIVAASRGVGVRRDCGRGGGRVGGSWAGGGRSAVAMAVADPIQAACDLNNKCFRWLTSVVEDTLLLMELRGMLDHVKKMILKLDTVEIARDDGGRREQRKSALMALETTAQHIKALVEKRNMVEKKETATQADLIGFVHKTDTAARRSEE